MMIPTLQRAAFAMILLVVGCRGEFGSVEASGSVERAQVMVFASGPDSGVTQAGLQVCRDVESWAQLWSRHLGADPQGSPLPVISFASESVVGIFLGRRPTGGYSLSVDGLEKGRDGWLLRTREVTPDEDTPVDMGESHPFVFVIVPYHVQELDWAPRH